MPSFRGTLSLLPRLFFQKLLVTLVQDWTGFIMFLSGYFISLFLFALSYQVFVHDRSTGFLFLLAHFYYFMKTHCYWGVCKEELQPLGYHRPAEGVTFLSFKSLSLVKLVQKKSHCWYCNFVLDALNGLLTQTFADSSHTNLGVLYFLHKCNSSHWSTAQTTPSLTLSDQVHPWYHRH